MSDIINYLVKNDTKEALDKIDYLGKKGKNFILFTTELIEYLKNMLISNKQYEINKSDIFEIIDILNDTVNNMKNSSYQKVLLEVSFLKIEALLENNKISEEKNTFSEKEIPIEIKKEKNNNVEKIEIKETNSLNEQTFELNKIRINNALALANKSLLEDLKICWIRKIK